MLYSVIGALSVVIIILIIRLNHKVKSDRANIEQERKELQEINKILETSKFEINKLIIQNDVERKKYRDLQEAITRAQEAYRSAVQQNTESLNKYIEEQRTTRVNDLQTELDLKKAIFEKQLADFELECNQRQEELERNLTTKAIETSAKIQQLEGSVLYEEEKYEALLEPLKQYEKDMQQKLFYTIYLPEEFRDDIDFLLNTVAKKVQHPDIISKLVWAEYVKPYLDETIKRVGIKAEPGIYKLTNIESGKAYIGKSTDIKKRIQDHFKSSVGIKSIADQYVHHEILKTGFWNWAIEYIIYCDKEDLSDLEKYYIDFFKTQEFGYNRKEGG